MPSEVAQAQIQTKAVIPATAHFEMVITNYVYKILPIIIVEFFLYIMRMFFIYLFIYLP